MMLISCKALVETILLCHKFSVGIYYVKYYNIALGFALIAQLLVALWWVITIHICIQWT